MDLKQLVMLALQVSILATVFGFGLRATTHDLLLPVQRPSLFGRSLLAMFVIMPLLAIALVRAFDFTKVVEIELLALAIAPIPPLLPRKMTKAGGSGSYAIALMATIGLLAIVIVPLGVNLLGRYFDREFAMSFSAVGAIVLKSILLPLLVGMVVRAVVPAIADRIVEPVAMIGKVLLPLAVLALLAGNLSAIWAAIGSANALVLAIFIVAGLATGHLLGGPDPDSRAVLAISSAFRHPAIAFAIASVNFPELRFGGVMLLYLLLGAVIGIPYVMWMHRKTSAAPALA